MQKCITIIRHAESLANAGGVTEDPKIIPLTEKGYDQAANLATWFNQQMDIIIYSPSLRTLETAKPLLKKFPQVPSEELGIQEFTYLDVTKSRGTTREERSGFAQKYWERNDPDYIDGIGSESFSDFIRRTLTFRKYIERSSVQHIVVFTHGQVVILLELLTKDSTGDHKQLMQRFYRLSQEKPIGNTEARKSIIDSSGIWSKFSTVFQPQE